MHLGFLPTKPLGCQDVSAQQGHENTACFQAKGLGGALGSQCFYIALLWDPGVSSRHLISAAKGWHLLLRHIKKAVRHLAEPKKVFENNWVECADLDIWRKVEESNRWGQGKRTNKDINRHQKWASHGAWPGCLRADARFCRLLWTPKWGPVCQCEALGISSAVPPVLRLRAVMPAVSQCRLCCSPSMQDGRGEMVSRGTKTGRDSLQGSDRPGSRKQSFPVPNTTQFTGSCSLSFFPLHKPQNG